MCSLDKIVSLSRTISFLSIGTNSPVSSSTKSSTHDFNTLAESLRPKCFLRPLLDTLISSARLKICKMSRSDSYPIAEFLSSSFSSSTLTDGSRNHRSSVI